MRLHWSQFLMVLFGSGFHGMFNFYRCEACHSISETGRFSASRCVFKVRLMVLLNTGPEAKDHMPAHYYPMFVSFDNRECLVVGGGPVGERKIRVLLQHGAAIRLVAENLTPWLKTQCDEGTVQLIGGTYTKDHLEDVDIVFAATGDPLLNRAIGADARQRKLWCNMATEPERGSFIVPSILQRGLLTIAISTGGASPALAVQIRQKLEHEFGVEWVVLLHMMALLRITIQSKGIGSAQNQEFYRRITELPLLKWIQRGEETKIVQAISDVCQPWINANELEQIWNEAWKRSS